MKDYPFKKGDRIFYPHYGCGTVVKAAPSAVDVQFAKGYIRPLSTNPPMRLATLEDEQYDPCAIIWAAEPINQGTTLADFANAVERWAEVVLCLDGDDNDDEIKHDLFCRRWLHGQFNNLKQQGVEIPSVVLDQLNKADQHFIAHSVALAPPDIQKIQNRCPCMGPITLQHPEAFWYEYRWPMAKK